MTTDLSNFTTSPQSTTSIGKRSGRAVTRGLVCTAALVALIGASVLPASAAPGDTSADTTEANVEVTTAIVLSGLTPAFTLDGIPGATVTGEEAVAMTVTTNNLAGYAVTVQSATATMVANTAGNTDFIPIANLGVREHVAGDETDPTGFTAMSSTAGVTVHTQGTRSAEAGDDLSNDFTVNIPFVNEDTYSATLNYIATTL